MKKYVFLLLSIVLVFLGTMEVRRRVMLEREALAIKETIPVQVGCYEYIPKDPWYKSFSVIAHAGGAINKDVYTNSVDAFESNYALGTRVFEADVALTSDNKLVLTHGWYQHSTTRINQSQFGGMPMSYDDFMKYKIYGKYEPMDFQQLLNMMHKNKDMYVVLDMKYSREYKMSGDYNDEKYTDDPQRIREFFEPMVQQVIDTNINLMRRIIIQIYTPEMYNEVSKLFPFTHYLYTTYLNYYKTNADEILDFAVANNIKAVALELGNAQLAEMQRRLAERIAEQNEDVHIFGFTYDEEEEYFDFTKNYGYTGIFSDYLNETVKCKKYTSPVIK